MAEGFRVETTRGASVETEHPILCAVVDAAGRVLLAAGDVDRPFPVRSTVKPLHTRTLIESGAADAFALTPEELAIASASHRGESDQVALVERWLTRLGLSAADLRCGPSGPDPRARLGHMCSGKHAGFLTLARHLEVEPGTYLDRDEPVQQLVLGRLAARMGVVGTALELAGDGCGAPVPTVPLRALARGMATLLDGDADAQRVLAALQAHPALVAGPGRFDTDALVALAGNGFTKVGADGMHVAVLREPAVAVAVKALSGDERAGETALVHVLCLLDAIDPATGRALAGPDLLDSRGEPVGTVAVRGSGALGKPPPPG